jgi:hypothetical protein
LIPIRAGKSQGEQGNDQASEQQEQGVLNPAAAVEPRRGRGQKTQGTEGYLIPGGPSDQMGDDGCGDQE